MIKQTILVLSALTMTACVGAGTEQTTFEKPGTLSSCPGVTGVSAQYLVPVAGLPVRCGPQTVSPVTYR